jgi:hypothetical protein
MARILKFSRFDKPFELYTGISGFVIGSVLMKVGRSIADESKKFASAQLRWPAHERSCF